MDGQCGWSIVCWKENGMRSSCTGLQGPRHVKQQSKGVGIYSRLLEASEEILVMDSCDLSCVFVSFWLLCEEDVGSQREWLWVCLSPSRVRGEDGLDQANGSAEVENPHLLPIPYLLGYFRPSLCLILAFIKSLLDCV